MAYSGKFQPKNPAKYMGDVSNIVWRSTWERKCMAKFDENPDIVGWVSEEIVIPYLSPVDGRWHRYFTDFFIVIQDSDGKAHGILIEVKPYKQTIPPEKKKRVTKGYLKEVTTWGVNSAKWEAAREVCKKKGWSFRIMTEKELNIK